MGVCVSKNIEGGNTTTQKDNDLNITILGTHQSGKTTIARQLMFAHGTTLTDMERQHLLSVIHNNIINTIQVLCNEAHTYGSISIDAEDAFQYFLTKCNSDLLDDLVVSWVRKLWNEAAIQTTYENRHNFYLRNPNNIQHFLDNLQQVARNDYLPTTDDIIRLSMRTTAFNHSTFQSNGLNLNLHDLGGLRSERQRWPNSLANQAACVYVVSLADYDQTLAEDRNVNRLTESIVLFTDLTKAGYFNGVQVIVVFTHIDIFTEKIAARNLSTTIPDYTGPSHDVEAAKDWIAAHYTSLKNNSGEAVVSQICFINALEVEQVKKCISSVFSKPTAKAD